MAVSTTQLLVYSLLVVTVFGSSSEMSGPSFQSELPREVVFTPEQGVTIDCLVQGQPTPQITWLSSPSKESSAGIWNTVSEIPHLRYVLPNNSLALVSFRKDHFRADVHAASYKCIAANPSGKIVSVPIYVQAVIIPVFDAVVESPRVQLGSTAVFRCSAPEAIREHITVTSWIQDNRYDIFPTSSQDGRHVMLPSGELHLLSVRNEDEKHSYQCRLLIRANSQTQTSNSAGSLLLLTEPLTKTRPTITDSKRTVRLWRGQDAALSCVAQGYPRPRIKWFRQTPFYGSLLIPVQHGGRYRLVSGTLIIRSLQADDQGRYLCVATNSIGVAEARTELVVRDKLQAHIDTSSLVVDAETQATIKCTWTGSPRPTVVWMKDAQRYHGNGNILINGNSAQLHLSSVQVQDQGMYQCFLYNDGDAAQATVQVRIGAFRPQITQTFSRQTVHPGTSVALKCVATGAPMPHFSWTLDGFPLPVSERYFLGQHMNGLGEAITFLNISHVQVEDGGNYKCIAENRVGRAEYTAALHVYGVPYVRPMGSITAVGGKRLELSCPVSGYPIEAIFWEKDGRRLPTNSRQRSYFNGTLIIDPVDKSADSGVYSCEARGQNRVSARQTIAINVIDAPHIMATPDAAYSNTGERLALQCAVTKGELPLTIQWRKGDNFIGNVAGVSVKNINDFTLSLTVESLTWQHSGRYTCLASNEGGRAEFTVDVVVQAAPRITPFTMPHVTVNARLHISCVIEEGDPPLTISWYRNGRPLHGNSIPGTPFTPLVPPGLRVTDFNAYSSILTIDHVAMSHAGNYSCWAENPAGSSVHATILRVSVPPQWISQPSDVQTISGHSAEIHCLIYGVPEPQIKWYYTPDKLSEKYTAVSDGNRTLLNNQSLIISPVLSSDKGFYQCEAYNGVGNSLSATVALQVNRPPEVVLAQDFMAVRRSAEAIIQCTVTGDSPLNVHWKKDGTLIDSAISPRITTKPSQNGDITTSELLIASTASTDEGLYECIATNSYGDDSDAVFVQVQDVPQPPQDVKLREISSRGMTIEWKAPTDSGNPIQHYEVYHKSLQDGHNSGSQLERIPSSQTWASLQSLQPAMDHQIYVVAANGLGQSQPSPLLTATTDEEVPAGPPLNVLIASATSRELLITFSPPATALRNGLIIGYYVMVREMGDESGRMLNRSLLTPTAGLNNMQYSLTSLRPHTSYAISIQAMNSKGTGPPSQDIIAKTLEDVPEQAPQNIACVAISSQSLQITWQPPNSEYRNGVIQGYRILFEPLVTTGVAYDNYEETVKTTSELTIFLSGLRSFSNYSVQLLAFTSVGDGVKSNPIVCSTAEDIPEVPTQLKAVVSGSDSIIVSWLPSGNPNGRITRYTVYSKETERGQETNVQKWSVPGNANRYEIRNLRKKTTYNLQVTASTRVGEGPRGPVVSFSFTPANKVAAAIVSIGTEDVIPQGSSIVLPCLAVGDFPLQMTWFHEDKQLQDWTSITTSARNVPPGEGTRLLIIPQTSTSEQTYDSFKNGSLVIRRFGAADAGNVSCRVRNRHGEDSVTYVLIAIVPPPAPILHFISSNTSSVTLQWSSVDTDSQLAFRAPMAGSSQEIRTSTQYSYPRQKTRIAPVRGYILRYRLRADSVWLDLSVSSRLRHYTVNNLSCGNEYEFQIMATSAVGNTNTSNVVLAKTKGAPPAYVREDQDDVVVTATSSIVYLTGWQDRGCPIQQFVFRFRTVDSSDWIIAGAESPPQKSFLLGGLQPRTSYIVRVSAISSSGTTHRDIDIKTEASFDDLSVKNREEDATSFLPFLADPRVAIPACVSVLALCLTFITIVLRYRYRATHSRNLPPNLQSDSPGLHEGHDTESIATTLQKRSLKDCSDRETADDDVSPYAVFPMPKSYNSTRRMKTFLVEKRQSVTSGDYGPNTSFHDPDYEYIAPCTEREFRSTRPSVPKINPQSAFIPIPVRGTGTTRSYHRPESAQWHSHETMAMTHRP